MDNTLVAVVPIFVLLVLGNLARRSGFLDESFWALAEKGTYFVLFPCLLVSRLWQADLEWQAQINMLLAIALLAVCAAAICFAAQFFLKLKATDFTSFFQGGVRFNVYVGLALAAVISNEAITLSTLFITVMIPSVNIACVTVYVLYSDAGMNWRAVGLSLLKNPLVMACLLGIVLNISGLPAPLVLIDVMDKLGVMALPMGLLAVGAGLRLKALQAASKAFTVNAVIKLLLVPLVAFLITRLFGFDPVTSGVLIVWAALPTASSAYILARQMRGNAELMAGIITGQTLLSLLTLPMVLWLVTR